MFICFFSRSNILHPAMLLFTDIEKGFIYIHYLVILFFLDQHALVPLTTGVYINSNRLLCA